MFTNKQNWTNKKVTQGLFLDVSTAFDKVWHNGLLAKLNQIGVEGTFLDTIGSYLAGRQQVGVVDGVKSDTLEVQAGVCLKANRKLSMLRSVELLSRKTLDLPVFYKSLKVSDLSRLDNIQYKAGKIATGTFHFTSKDKLNSQLGWEKILKRGDILSLHIFHKIHLHETRPLIRECMPKHNIDNTCKTRSKGGYII